LIIDYAIFFRHDTPHTPLITFTPLLPPLFLSLCHCRRFYAALVAAAD
jgi:hypothetical protein